jgi:hypothetical protein
LIAAAAAVAIAALWLFVPLMPTDAENKAARQEIVNPPAGVPVLPQTVPPVLKIDGTGDSAAVRLQSNDVRVEVAGGFASVRHTLVFKNETADIREGELTFSLPAGCGVTHFALDIDGGMREGVPVEKAHGARAYEEITRRRVDPGLLEIIGDNSYRVRVYPVPPNGTRVISIGYEYELPAPADTLSVSMRRTPDGCYFVATVVPNLEARQKQWSDELAIIWDVSLSGLRRDLRREMEMLNIIFTEKKNASAHLYFLNNKFKKAGGAYKIIDGKWDELKSVLDSAVFDGGTDFSQINLNNIAGNEILFFSDGNSTLGDAADFVKKATAKRPVHCVVSSANADSYAMRLIAGKTNGKFIDVSALSPENLKHELLYETPMFLGAEHGKTVREIYPGVSVPIPVSGGFSAAGIFDTVNTELTLLFGYGGKVEKRVKVALDAKNADTAGNAHKIWAQKKIAELDFNRKKNSSLIAEVGRRFGVVTRSTSLIVLETLSDYIRYGIEPPAEMRAEYRYAVKLREFIDAKHKNQYSSSPIWALNSAYDRFVNGVRKMPKSEAELEAEYRRITKLTELLESGTFGERMFELLLENYAFKTEKSDAELQAEYNRVAKLEALFKADYPSTAIELLVAVAMFGTSKNEAELGAQYRRVVEMEGWFSALYKRRDQPDINRLLTDCINGKQDVRKVVKPILRAEAIEKKRAMMKQITALDFIQYTWSSVKRRWDSVVRYILNTPVCCAGGDFFEKLPDERMVYENEVSSPANQPAIIVKPVKRDNYYLGKLTGELAEDYRIYLKLREAYINSPTFYFDMADWFHTRGDRETALRILTSVAELEFESTPLYRLLGYRFKEYGEYALEKYVCQNVMLWQPIPQSYRDYALALADNGEEQAALDVLYSILTERSSQISPSLGIKELIERLPADISGLEENVIMEINRLLAKNANLNTSKIDRRLSAPSAADIRVVINWNFDDTDIDLHVTDPNGETCFYENRETKLGGRISEDYTEGYGPEQFVLKRAVKGKYRVYVNYYGARQFTAAGPATVMAEVYTKYAGKAEQRRVVCLQISKANIRNIGDEKLVEVAEFEF